jgi:hypothetical protein
LFGILPAMLIGVVVNALILIVMYWKLLSGHKDVEDRIAEVAAEEEVNSHQFSPATMSHYSSSLNSQVLNGYLLESSSIQDSLQVQNLRNRLVLNDSESHRFHVGSVIDSAKNSNASKEGTNNDLASETKVETGPSKTVVEIGGTMDGHVLVSSDGKDCLNAEQKRLLWKTCVYLITLGMLIAMLLGLSMSWTAISAALALVVLDFKDARPSLEKVL